MAGWGAIGQKTRIKNGEVILAENGHEYPNFLYEVKLKTVNHEKCIGNWIKHNNLILPPDWRYTKKPVNKQFCASARSKDSCVVKSLFFTV